MTTIPDSLPPTAVLSVSRRRRAQAKARREYLADLVAASAVRVDDGPAYPREAADFVAELLLYPDRARAYLNTLGIVDHDEGSRA